MNYKQLKFKLIIYLLIIKKFLIDIYIKINEFFFNNQLQ